MIAIDTSALVAIALNEPEAARFSDVIARHPTAILIGAPSLVKLHLVMNGRLGAAAARRVVKDSLPAEATVVAFDAEHAAAAQDAFDRYGKGRHPAALNFGDCMAYAIARVAGCPLLYKGEDFARTDIRAAA